MSSNQRDERGYSTPYEGQNYVTRNTKGVDVELSMDADGLEVSIERGSGYMHEQCATFIHVDVLVAMLAKAGFTITKIDPECSSA